MKIKQLLLLTGIAVLLATMITCKQESFSDLSKDQKQWIEKTLMSMSTEQKVGQLLAPAIAPPRSDSDLVPFERINEWIKRYNIGHVYMASSRRDPVRTGRFINSIQDETYIPLLIHSDLETGPGSRFDGGTILPPFMGIAQTRSDTLAYNAAVITAKEARAMEIHLINSPVLDVNINPENPVICIRSFGDNPELIAKLGKAHVKGLNDPGIISLRPWVGECCTKGKLNQCDNLFIDIYTEKK
jgi:beta-N-acetylhexosaminidase